LPFSPVKLSALIERVTALDKRARFPSDIPSPLKLASIISSPFRKLLKNNVILIVVTTALKLRWEEYPQ
jgi:hypothetical protein